MRQPPASKRALTVISLIEELQTHFARALAQHGPAPEPVEWLRDEGRHGGGVRFALRDTEAFDRASINFSCVHYDDLPEKKLESATALSAIVHPANAHAPSMHTHISHTQMRSGKGGWRLMADLNPSLVNEKHKAEFLTMLDGSLGPDLLELSQQAQARGDRYFTIPALQRERGVAHFYLEGYDSGDFEKDFESARQFGLRVIDSYASILADGLSTPAKPSDEQAQLAYHSLYFFQVLTLDRGTTSGLLVHDQNDVGILGSLPSRVDPKLLSQWIEKCPAPQDALLRSLINIVSDGVVSDDKKALLAKAVREHYRQNPKALALQASGDVIPTTTENHL